MRFDISTINIPSQSGVYFKKDYSGNVIYIGKAKKSAKENQIIFFEKSKL
jgi:excinuclease UvrABC nuclease subunit